MNPTYRLTLSTLAAALLLAVLGLASAAPASAATITVCASGCDYTSIQDGVDNASAWDVIELEAETYNEGEISISTNLTIRTSSGMATVQGGGSDDHVFQVTSGTWVIFEDLKMKGGTDCRLDNAGNVFLSTVWVLGTGPLNPSTYGGIRNQASGSLTIEDSSLVSANASTSYGGGVSNYGDLVIVGSTFSSNTGYEGGGVHNDEGIVSVMTSSFSFNDATHEGGAWANVESSGTFAFHSSASYSVNTADDDCEKYLNVGGSPSCVN